MNDFGSASLDGKVILSKGNLRLSRIAVLRHKIAGVARQHNVIYLSLST